MTERTDQFTEAGLLNTGFGHYGPTRDGDKPLKAGGTERCLSLRILKHTVEVDGRVFFNLETYQTPDGVYTIKPRIDFNRFDDNGGMMVSWEVWKRRYQGRVEGFAEARCMTKILDELQEAYKVIVDDSQEDDPIKVWREENKKRV